MEVGKDDILFELIKNRKVQIRDSNIAGFNIFLENWELCIEIDFQYFEKEPFRIRFSGVEEYGFYHNSTYTFYIVEAFKILKDNDLYYTTFDPEDERDSRASENDTDFIWFKSFQAYAVAK